MVNVQKQQAGNCCGATMIYDFHGSVESKTNTGLSRFSNDHLYLAVLTEYQSKMYSKVLEDKGFRVASKRVVNGNTGNVLYLWVRDNPHKKTKKVKSIFARKS